MATSDHTRLVKLVLLELGSRADCRVWQNNTGAANYGGRYLKFGKVGSGDIIGFTSDGKFLAIECKTGSGRQSKEQANFELIVKRFGGRYYLVRDHLEIAQKLDALNLPLVNTYVAS